MQLPYSRQSIGAEEVDAVAAAVQDALLTGGPTLARFEAALAERTGARHAIAVSSGTAALHVAYRAAGVGATSTVLTQPLTFVATANAALYCGARVGFADVDAHGGLAAEATAAWIARHGQPDVVVPVHWAGHPVGIAPLGAVAPNAVVIEDACHALGATYRDASGRVHAVGACAHAAMAVFSFHPVKTITTGEGGAIVTNDAILAARCRRFRDHGLDRDAATFGPWGYVQRELGYNYRLTDLQAALGCVQLGRLDGFLAARRAIAAHYDAAFAGHPAIRPVAPRPGTTSGYHLYPVRVPASCRRPVYDALRARGIGVQVHYVPVHLQPLYRERSGTLPGDCLQAEQLYAEELSLPCFPGMTDADVRTVVAAIDEDVARALEARAVEEWGTQHAHCGG